MIILKTTDRGRLTIPKAWRDKMPAKDIENLDPKIASD